MAYKDILSKAGTLVMVYLNINMDPQYLIYLDIMIQTEYLGYIYLDINRYRQSVRYN